MYESMRVHRGWKRIAEPMFACVPWTGSAGTICYMLTESRFTNAPQAGLWYGVSMGKTGIRGQPQRSSISDLNSRTRILRNHCGIASTSSTVSGVLWVIFLLPQINLNAHRCPLVHATCTFRQFNISVARNVGTPIRPPTDPQGRL